MNTIECRSKSESELNLLLPETILHEPLWKSLIQNADEFFFPKKLPPLVLTSKPAPVKDIWGFYDYHKNAAYASTLVHVVMLAAIIGVSLLGRKVVQQITRPQATVMLVAPDDLFESVPSKEKAGGGGGGGDRDKLQARKGKLPKFAMQQIVPPAVVIRNEHPKLTAEPTVVVPPEIHLAMKSLPSLGDPMSPVLAAPPSNGPGFGGGIGSGSGGGVGSGEGPGVGPGRGGGIGGGDFHNGGIFRVGGEVSPPRPIFTPDPEYSEEARKAKYQGVCVLLLVVGSDGKTRDVHVARSLGLGLDEKAIEAVRQWRFEPARKDGKAVAVRVNVEVTFRLY